MIKVSVTKISLIGTFLHAMNTSANEVSVIKVSGSTFLSLLDNAQLAGILNDVITNAASIEDVDVDVCLLMLSLIAHSVFQYFSVIKTRAY